METGKLLTDRVADEIVRSIIGQKLKPGDKLPNEFELAKTLGVGRSTLREAIKTLVSRSVVEIRRGSGTFVSARSGVSEDPLGLEFLTDKVQVATDLLELRFLVEPRLASLAASRCAMLAKRKCWREMISPKKILLIMPPLPVHRAMLWYRIWRLFCADHRPCWPVRRHRRRWRSWRAPIEKFSQQSVHTTRWRRMTRCCCIWRSAAAALRSNLCNDLDRNE